MINQEDFVAAFEAAASSEYERLHAKPLSRVLLTKPRQSGCTKRSSPPSVRENDAALEAKYCARQYKEI
jgi:hypothetical protein